MRERFRLSQLSKEEGKVQGFTFELGERGIWKRGDGIEGVIVDGELPRDESSQITEFYYLPGRQLPVGGDELKSKTD